MSKPVITSRQATMWFTLNQLGSALLVLPSSLTSFAKQDAWLCIPLAIAAFLAISPLFIVLAKRIGSGTLLDYMTGVMGNMLGKTVMVLFLLVFPYLIFALALMDLSTFVTTSIIPETPPEAIQAIILVAVVLAVRKGVTVIGRAAEILFFIVMLLIAIGYLSLIPELRFDFLLPVLENGLRPVVRGSILLLSFPYLEGILYLFIKPNFQDSAKWKQSLIKSTLLSGTIFLIITVTVIATLSSEVTADVAYPSYFVIRTISYAEIYQRFEIVIAILWYITIFFRLTLLLHVVRSGLSDTFAFKNQQLLAIPLALIGFVMAKDVLPNYPSAIKAFDVWSYHVIMLTVAFPCILLTLDWIKKARENGQSGKTG